MDDCVRTQRKDNLRLASLGNELAWFLSACLRGEKKRMDGEDAELVKEGLSYARDVQKGYEIELNCLIHGVVISKQTLRFLEVLHETKDVMSPSDVDDVKDVLSSVVEKGPKNLDKSKLENVVHVFRKLTKHALKNPVYPEAFREII